jgi:hypothetical protein
MFTWVPHGSRSGSSHSSPPPTAPSSKLLLQAPTPIALAPTPSSLPLNVYGALAME